MPGFKYKLSTRTFEKYSQCLTNYFELKTQSRHTDVGLMAKQICDFEQTMSNVSDQLSPQAHLDLSEIWQLIHLLSTRIPMSQTPKVTDMLLY